MGQLSLWAAVKTRVCSVTQLSLTLCYRMDGSPPGSPWDRPGKSTGVGCHVLLQGIFPTQTSSNISCVGWWVLPHWATWEAPRKTQRSQREKKTGGCKFPNFFFLTSRWGRKQLWKQAGPLLIFTQTFRHEYFQALYWQDLQSPTMRVQTLFQNSVLHKETWKTRRKSLENFQTKEDRGGHKKASYPNNFTVLWDKSFQGKILNG